MIEGRAIAIEDKDPDADYAPASEAMLRRMAIWVKSMNNDFPLNPASEKCAFENSKIPVESWLVTPPIATDNVYSRCAQYVIEAASHLRSIKPDSHKTVRVSAIIGYPDMFSSEVCVFFDEAYFRRFAIRQAVDHYWTPLPVEKSLAGRLNLKIPDGFAEQGYHTYWRDDDVDEGDEPYVSENETWIYSEILAGD